MPSRVSEFQERTKNSTLPENSVPREVGREAPNQASRLRESFEVEALGESAAKAEASVWTEASCSRVRKKTICVVN